MESKDELQLAEELKSKCYPNGMERQPKESAKILHRIGIVYRKKSPDKQSLIQSVALMTSAIIREPDNVEEIKRDLEEVCSHVLDLAHAANRAISLTEHVKNVKEQWNLLRFVTQKQLKSLKCVSNKATPEILKNEENQKIKDVALIQDFVTMTYKTIMNSISKCCIEILGSPPCKFALVGMGSIARDEVTPYSDFESILVLEDEVQNANHYERILNYFRWFAVIFQIILVRLGETILRFLAIPCLNDPFKPENNWFYDAYTLCGVCPDGFAPTASKNPLGRQMPTPDKPWTTELIKPVSEMIKYLDSKEDLKNGYRLADVLMYTCFVSGSQEVYDTFDCLSKKTIRAKTEEKDYAISLFKRLQSDLTELSFIRRHLQENTEQETLDVKRFFYRGTTLFIHSLGRLFGIEKQSSMDIVDSLLQSFSISPDDVRKLKLAIAVSCEVRLRFYSARNGQSDTALFSLFQGDFEENLLKQIATTIGSNAVVSSVVTCIRLHGWFEYYRRKLGDSSTRMLVFALPPPTKLMFLRACAILEFPAELVQYYREHLKDDESSLSPEDLCHVRCSYAFSLYNLQRWDDVVHVIENTFPHWRDLGGDVPSSVYDLLGRSLVNLRRFDDAYECVKFFQNSSSAQPYTDGFIGRCLLSLGRYDEAMTYVERDASLITEGDPDELRWKRRAHEPLLVKADCLLNQKRYRSALDTLLLVQNMCQVHSWSFYEDSLASRINFKMSMCHFYLGEYRQALQTLNDVDNYDHSVFKLSLGSVFQQWKTLLMELVRSPEMADKILAVRSTWAGIQRVIRFKDEIDRCYTVYEEALKYGEMPMSTLRSLCQKPALYDLEHRNWMSLMLRGLLEISQFKKALIFSRELWRDASGSKCPKQKCATLTNLGACFKLLERNSDWLSVQTLAFHYALQAFDNPVTESAFIQTITSYIRACVACNISPSCFPVHYTPTVFWYAIDSLPRTMEISPEENDERASYCSLLRNYILNPTKDAKKRLEMQGSNY